MTMTKIRENETKYIKAECKGQDYLIRIYE